MKKAGQFKVLRINADTFPVKPKERKILSGMEIIEIEQPEECQYLEEIDAVMIVSAYLHAPEIKRLTKCRIIARIGTGTDKIDVNQATEQGIIVTNVPDFATGEVADHTMALLLSAARRLKYYETSMRSGTRPFEVGNIRRLSVQTLGIIGFGHIGCAVAKRAQAFGLRVIVCDPGISLTQANECNVVTVDKETVLAESDYLCLLCPLLPSTRGMLAMPEFRKMKRDAILINTGRGELVNENDLAEALRLGIIAYAGLDVFGVINVFKPEGFNCNHPLFGLNNVQLTPHVAANSREALEEAHTRAAQAVADTLNGKAPAHVINPLR
jgi:D-3-phosphoglycerate dehydrogenase